MISQDTAILRFKRFFSFMAGQVINISTSENIPPRMYSICSGENDPIIEILYKLIPTGDLTPELSKLKDSDQIYVSNPFGKFLAKSGPAFLIATGTGIAPFISMIRSGNKHQKTLIHGSRILENFYYEEYLSKELATDYIACYTGKENTQLFKGRVSLFLQNHHDLPTNIKYYLCGSAEMVVDTRDILIKKGIPFQNILSEIYF